MEKVEKGVVEGGLRGWRRGVESGERVERVRRGWRRGVERVRREVEGVEGVRVRVVSERLSRDRV